MCTKECKTNGVVNKLLAARKSRLGSLLKLSADIEKLRKDMDRVNNDLKDQLKDFDKVTQMLEELGIAADKSQSSLEIDEADILWYDNKFYD